MPRKLRFAVFKLIDIIVILTMVLASPMNISAAAMADNGPATLLTNLPDYAPGESAQITGSGFDPGDYVLAANGPDGSQDWGTVTADVNGVFAADSPELDSAGAYEVRAYASGWGGDWEETPIARAGFSVSAPPPATELPTETPTEAPTATEPPTSEPTEAPTEVPTETPTVAPTETATEEPTVQPTDTPTSEPTATELPTETPINTPTPSGPPTILSDKDDYFPGELVTLTGTNWQGDTEVRLIVNDDVGQTWKRDVIVTVAEDGTIFDSFNLPAWFVATYFVTASGQQTGRVVNYSFTDSDGSYSLDFSAADPGDSPTYPKVTPAQLACPAPSGGTGRAADPLANAIFGNPNDSVESLAPEDMILGQIVPFETEIRVNGTVAPEGGRIKIVQTFLAKTTSGGNFGFDPAYGVYCAFIDTADSANSTLAAGTKVESFSFTILQPGTANERIEATIIISGLVNPERAVLETWVVLKNTIPAGVSGNVQTTIGPAQTCTNAGCTTGGSISTGNQTVPLLRVQEFFTNDADVSITKSDNPDPVVAGSQLTYTVNVTNNSAQNTANGIVVTDTLDPNTTFVSSSLGAACSAVGQVVTCNLGGLTPGQSTSFTITVNVSNTAPTAGTVQTGECTVGQTGVDLCNRVSVTAINDDPTPGNNSDTEPTNVLPLGGITINKVALGGDATFGYTTTGTGLSGFNITTTSGSGSQSFTNIAPGAKTVTESAPPAGWDFTSLSCSDPDNGTTTSGQTANIDLDPGESITCTYTNTKRGTIIVEKQTNPDGQAGSFTFTGTAAGTIADNGQITVSNLAPGTYTSTETDPAPTFGLTSIACDDGASTTPSTFDLGTRTATFKLDPGETVKCTFTNSLQQGTLTVIKTVVNDNGGTATSSQWSIHVTSGGTDVAGSPQPGSATGTNYALTQGTYNVSETGGPSGYTFTGFSGDCDSSGNVTVVAGQTKTCTLTNNDQPATLIVKKVVVNDNGGTLEEADFSFQVNGGSAMPFEADGQNDLTVDAGTYTVTEPAVSGYSTSYDNCSDLVIPNGGSATCTITNDDQAATLIVKKVVVNDNGGTLEVDDFTFQVNGGSAMPFEADGQNDLSVSAGTYSVTEPAVSGYSTTYDNCSDLVIPNGGSATCTITNNDQAATLIVKKVVINDNGGTLEAEDFSFQVNGGSAITFESDGQNNLTVDAGTYTATEPAVSGYSTSYNNCSDLIIPNGGSATCTITNDDRAATLIVKKVVINDNGGTLEEADFSFQVNGGAAIPFEADGQNDLTVDAGTYTVTEPAVSGYTTTYDNCSDLIIPNGGSATCTITNDDQAAHLKLVKVVTNDNGGTAAITDFTLSAAGPTPISGAGGVESDVNAGTYTLSETNVPGYTASAWSCVGGTQSGSDITLTNGESATCTITNNDNAPSLTLVKAVINDNGGTAVAADFMLSADGPTPISGAGGATSDATFEAGTYDLSEINVTGYAASDWVCVGGTQDDPDTVTLGLGESATCTITNDDIAPQLHLRKVVVNDNGGSATEADFTLTADGTDANDLSGTSPVDSSAGLQADTWALSETNLSGYTASAWSCVGGTQNGSNITLDIGEEATCTITNDDQQAFITVVKVVTNDNGGSAQPDDFDLTLEGNAVLSGVAVPVNPGTYTAGETLLPGYTFEGFSGACDSSGDVTVALGESKTCTLTNNDQQSYVTVVKVVVNNNGGNAGPNDFDLTLEGNAVLSGVAVPVNPGTYTAGETLLPGYTFEGFSGACDSNGDVTVALGESKTCTLTNNDIAPTLTLIKVVVNDDGGNAVVTDFPLFINGNPVTSGVANQLDANTLYTASETSLPGYTASIWGGDCAADGTITLNEGENKTCTITNDDVAPTLKLVKVVNNDNGGNAVANDWVLYAVASAPNNGRNFSNLGGSGTFQTVFANTSYDLSESVVAGYAASSWICDGGSLVGSTVTLAEGETGVTCTITNDDSAPTLTLVKVVVNDDGGNAVVTDFPLFINGNQVTSGVANILSANTLYTASETSLSGYTASTWGGDCAPDGTITLSEGQNATCTITNDDVAPTLKLVKIVDNGDGGNAVADDWTLSADAATPFDARNFSNAGGSGVFETIFANQGYDLAETSVPGYAAGSWVCDGGTLNGSTVTLEEGQNVTCTITNNDIAPTLTLIKVVINDNGGNAEPNDFSLTIDGNAALSGVIYTLEANTPYAINETLLSGYSFVSVTGDPECPAVLGGTVTLDEGENITCTITNDDVASTLTLVKNVINDNGGNAQPIDFNLTIDGSPAASGTAYTLDANTPYAINETVVSGYTFVEISGDPECPEILGGTVTLDEGENVTCTITNDDVAPTLTLVKVVVNDDGGNAVVSDFPLFINGNPVTSGSPNAVNANTLYTASETTLAGYTPSIWGGDCAADGTITLNEGDSKTCTITNDDVAPMLKLVKVVDNGDGGNAVADDWTLSATAAVPFDDRNFSNAGGSGDFESVYANQGYDLNESTVAGYTAGSWSCDGGTLLGSTVTLNEGETSVTCTITNDDVAPTLKLVKVVNNDNGGNAVANDWVLYALASAPNNGRNFSNLGGSGSFETIYANIAYDLSESVVAGYTASSWSCDGGTLVGSTVTLAEGETGVTCTITNDDSAPTLTLIKVVVNDDGGNAVVADFPLFISGNPTTSGQSNTLSANTLYTASETNLAGYSASAWGGDCAADGTITLSEGQNATCTITNDDVAPTLKLVKNVSNDNGGNAVANDWTLSADAATPFDARNFSNAGGSGAFETIFSNQGYDLSETTLPGYTADNWSCDGGTLTGSTVTLEEGQNVTCTITNDDVAPQLRIIKNVINDDGGNAVVADFPLFIDGNGVLSGVFVPVTANEEHTASETTQAGYTASAWGGDCAADGTVTLNEGDIKTCTITNDDIAPTLKLVKNVSNDNGGNATANDWTLSADAAAPFDGRNFSNPGGSGIFETVFANAGYDLSETTLSGYTAGAWSCDGGTLVGSTVTLAEGETEITCSITNNDSAPTLTLIKNVVNDNGGNAQPDDFNLTIGGSPAISGTPYTLDANTPYAIDETQLSGYTFVNITGDPECPAVLGGTVTLDEGENVTCTITNDDVAPTLTLIKNVINDHGGNAQPNDFNLTIAGNAALSGVPYALDANIAYAIDETQLSGYTFVDITGDPECPAILGGTVTLDEGENVTCTITNNDQAATLIVIKHVVNDNGGTADAADFTLDSGGTDDTPDNFPGEEAPGTTVTLDAGAYNVTESGPSGYSASFSANCSGSIANGETKTCTVTNDDIQPRLIVIKHVITDNGGTAVAADFTMSVTGNDPSPSSFAGAEAPGTNVAVNAGSYSVGETGPAGYAASYSADCTGTIAVGETRTCTVTNNDISPTLTVIKDLLPASDTGKFNLQIDGVTKAANVGDNGTTGAVAVNAGVVHTVGETAGTGTNLTDYVSTIGGDCAVNGTVSLALAENKTCTITNVRRGSIIIVKNTLGGNGTFNFTSSTLGNFSLTTSGGTASTTFSGLDPASTYDVGETVPAGWELNSATCSSGETIDSINLDPGETVTCTFENEKAGSIVIVKNTVGGNGTFNFTSSTLGSFSLTTSSNTASTTFSNLDVDITYDVAETVPAGWDLTSATCNSGETINSIDLSPGETVTCTFTNTQRGHIIVDKVTLPSGDTQSFAFATTGSGYTGFNLTDAAAPNDQTLVPGSYSVTEGILTGWDLTGLTCNDPSGGTLTSPTTRKATISLAAGETVTCTFTNTKRGTITIIKDSLPNDAQDFAFATTGSGLSGFSLDDDSNATLPNSKTFTNLLPGAYSVTEGAVAGWDLTGLTCNDANGTTSPATRRANIALDPGENVTCTFTNTKRGTIIVEKQTSPDGAPGSFTFTGTAAGTISDNGTITVSNLVPGTYTSTEANPAISLFALTSIVCNDGSSANPSTGSLATRTATFKLDPGETVRCVFTNTKDFHAGTIGFWKNWRNHYTSAQAQLLINYLKTNNPKIYNKDLILNNADDFTIAKWDAIFNVGTATPREQMILAQFTALKLNLAISQLDGSGGLVQKNDDLCTAGIVNVSSISGAATFFGTSTPTVGQIVNAVENKWIGNLTTNRNDWKWNLTNAQKDMLIRVISGINEGTLVMSSGCP